MRHNHLRELLRAGTLRAELDRLDGIPAQSMEAPAADHGGQRAKGPAVLPE